MKLGSVVLMKVQTDLAFISVNSALFDMPVNMIWAHFTNPDTVYMNTYCVNFIKSGDKPAAHSTNACGESFADLVKRDSSNKERRFFIVADEDICRFIKSNLNIDSFRGKKAAVREVCWGLRNALPLIIDDRYDITSCPLPLCQGFQVLMKQHQIVIPAEAVDARLLYAAGSLQRLEELKMFRCRQMRKACDKLVPGISAMIKDNFRYIEVMAKILIPSLFKNWGPSKWSTAAEPWFTPDEMKVIVDKDVAAGDARKKVKGDSVLAAMIEENLNDYRKYPLFEATALELLWDFEAKANRRAGKKRSHKEMAEQEVVEVAQGTKRGENGAAEAAAAAAAEGTKGEENGAVEATEGTKGEENGNGAVEEAAEGTKTKAEPSKTSSPPEDCTDSRGGIGFILDSRAAQHATGCADLLSGPTRRPAPEGGSGSLSFRTRGGEVLDAVAVGSVATPRFLVHQVYQVPGLDVERAVVVVSVRQLTRLGLAVTFGCEACDVRDRGTGALVGEGRLREEDGFYYLDYLRVPLPQS